MVTLRQIDFFASAKSVRYSVDSPDTKWHELDEGRLLFYKMGFDRSD